MRSADVSSIPVMDRSRYIHEACLYESDDELLDVVVPFLDEGSRAGEAALVNLDDRRAALVRAALDDPGQIAFVADAQRYSTPASTIQRYRQLFEAMIADGATRIRAIGELPAPGIGMPWDPWARYEAAINRAFADLPVWGICAYDLRSTTESVLDDVACTHPRIARVDGTHVVNDSFEDPAAWLERRPPAPSDPLESTAPMVELRDPWPHHARHAVRPLAGHLPVEVADDIATSVSEIVANAHSHGAPPVRLRAWTAPDRVVVTVHDEGSGPRDPFAGLLPPDRELGQGGLGLWITHQICSDVAMIRGDDGFSVRVVVGTPTVPDRDIGSYARSS